MNRIATKIALSVLGAAGISFLSWTPARAVIFVEPIVTTVNEDIFQTREPRTLGPDILPGQIIEYGVPDRANNLINGTGNDIGSFVFDLQTLFYTNPDADPSFANEPVQWGDVDGDGRIGFSSTPGLEDIFTNVTIEGNILTYSGGVIRDGDIFYNLFSTQPNLTPGGGIIPAIPAEQENKDGPIRVGASYTAIPESTNVLGVLIFGALGVAFKLKRSLHC
ncbi:MULTISPECIES: hypothetical protein [Nostoc]|uniref:PEP-CTERM sorting domain-containing protein n=2 Tax=Nostoc TaxID=1177 RepID=A0ABR8IBC3_9NOSO|nr:MULTISPECIES: hypothetical protein [Nostoc]MBD2562481.1 hypothetical protein [Nostoc linckia FACHB-391]MBD2647775.1 hypothetical protein [Nostoc foliaceum FACHB-393]